MYHITVPPRIDCCVVLSTSRIAAPILDRSWRRRFRPLQWMRRRRLIFPSPPSLFPNVNPKKMILSIATPRWVDCCVVVKQNAIVAAQKEKEDYSNFSFSFFLLPLAHTPARTVYCLCCLYGLIVVLRNQTVLFSTYSLIIYRGPWPIVMDGDKCHCYKTPPPLPGARGASDHLRSE